MKKVIEQIDDLENVIIDKTEESFIWLFQDGDEIYIEKSKAREVALAICPELGEPTIRQIIPR